MAAKLRLTELDALAEAAECLRTLAHPHRLRMVQMLFQGDHTWANWRRRATCRAPWHPNTYG